MKLEGLIEIIVLTVGYFRIMIEVFWGVWAVLNGHSNTEDKFMLIAIVVVILIVIII